MPLGTAHPQPLVRSSPASFKSAAAKRDLFQECLHHPATPTMPAGLPKRMVHEQCRALGTTCHGRSPCISPPCSNALSTPGSAPKSSPASSAPRSATPHGRWGSPSCSTTGPAKTRSPASPHQDVAVIEVEHTQPMEITVPAFGSPHYLRAQSLDSPLAARRLRVPRRYGRLVSPLIKHGQTVEKHLMLFKRLPA